LAFIEGGASSPADEAIKHCPHCGCKGTVYIPVENGDKMRRNEDKMIEHNRSKTKWEALKVSGRSIKRTGAKGQTCERGSKRLVMDRLSWVYHCHQILNPNPQRPDNLARTCVLKGRDIKTGLMYQYIMVEKRVTFPFSLCNCTTIFKVSIGIGSTNTNKRMCKRIPIGTNCYCFI